MPESYFRPSSLFPCWECSLACLVPSTRLAAHAGHGAEERLCTALHRIAAATGHPDCALNDVATMGAVSTSVSAMKVSSVSLRLSDWASQAFSRLDGPRAGGEIFLCVPTLV